jgi:hypothetical protein
MADVEKLLADNKEPDNQEERDNRAEENSKAGYVG